MNQVIFANQLVDHESYVLVFDIGFVPISELNNFTGAFITAKPNEDFIIEYITPSKTIKTIEVNRETLSIQKINQFDKFGGEYHYEINIDGDPANDGDAIQIIRQDAVPHQRNSWYIELSGNNKADSFWKQFKVLAKSDLLGITQIDEPEFWSKYPITMKFIGFEENFDTIEVVKNPYQYLKMLLTKHVQNLGYNHTDDNAELNSGLADYKAWIAGTEKDATVAVYRLRFATNRKASKTRDERVWQNVYICTKGDNNTVAALLDKYIAILNGETTTEGGGE